MKYSDEFRPIVSLEEFNFCGWIPCVSGHLDFRLMSVGLSGNYVPEISEGFIEYFSSKISACLSRERQNHQDKSKHSINYSRKSPNDNRHDRRVVLQSWVNWRDRKVTGYGEFRVIVVAEASESDNLDEREMQGHICIFPRYYTDENHPNNTEVQLSASKPLMDIIGNMGATFEKRKETKDSYAPKSNTDNLNVEWLKLHDLMASGQPLGDNPDLEYVFLVQFKICHNGITFLKYIPSPITETVKTRNAEQVYLITRQAFYYLKYSIHKHKHHNFEADALTTTIQFDNSKKQHIGLQLLNQLKKELIRIKRIQTLGVMITNQHNNALGIVGYARALLASIKSSELLPPGIEEREQEYLKSLEQSFQAQNNSQLLKHNISENAGQVSRQIIALSLSYISITLLLMVNLFVPNKLPNDETENTPQFITYLQSLSNLEFFFLSVFGIVFFIILMWIIQFFKSIRNYPRFLNLLRNLPKKYIHATLGIPTIMVALIYLDLEFNLLAHVSCFYLQLKAVFS